MVLPGAVSYYFCETYHGWSSLNSSKVETIFQGRLIVVENYKQSYIGSAKGSELSEFGFQRSDDILQAVLQYFLRFSKPVASIPMLCMHLNMSACTSNELSFVTDWLIDLLTVSSNDI
uniref:Uncharacterized protein n=1 Tax=Glossina austeni TaxID=7395 RepID=A0A1A9UVY5_GLOAU